jgi:hypothetical protein
VRAGADRQGYRHERREDRQPEQRREPPPPYLSPTLRATRLSLLEIHHLLILVFVAVITRANDKPPEDLTL